MMSDKSMNNEDEITLGVLSSVQENHEVTQRGLSKDLGIALGLTNAYLKRCMRKGLIKVQQIPRNRYAYYLTPEGFSEKSRLTTQFLSTSFNFYRRARSQCEDLFQQCENKGWRRVSLYAVSDLAEIALLCANRFDVELVSIVDPKHDGEFYHHVRIARSLGDAGPFDAIILTDLNDAQGSYTYLHSQLSGGNILAPDFMHISPDSKGP